MSRPKTVPVKRHKRSTPDQSKSNNKTKPKTVPVKQHKRAKPKGK